MVVRVEVAPELITWARQRSRIDRDELLRRFPKLDAWEAGEVSPTLRQVEEFARVTRTPIGYLFLSEPPDEPVPIPDFRTMAGTPIGRPSPELLDTIYQCQQRQDWFREHALAHGFDPVTFVGSLSVATSPMQAAAAMQEVVRFPIEERGSTWAEAFRRLVARAEDAGVLVMVSGVVGANTHRRLDPAEFRGFALVDAYAPVVFINGADTRAAQVFTLAHELAHIWLGRSGLDDVDLGSEPVAELERWCNRVAAEFLVPLGELRERYRPTNDLRGELQRLAAHYKVSTLVVLRRLYEAEYLSWENYRLAYREELERVLPLVEETGGGGNFYHTQPSRVSKLFAREVIASALEGQTLLMDALRMLGIRKKSTFDALAERLGVA